jgi:hypothetical protein
VLYFVVSASFQNVCKTDKVAVHICQWVLDRIADSSLGCHVDHALWFVFRKSLFYGRAVGQVYPEVFVVRVFCVACQSCFFEGRVIVIVVVVDADYLVTSFKQTEREG